MKSLTRILSVLLAAAALCSTAEGQGSTGLVAEDHLAVAVYGSDAVVVGTLTRLTEETRDDAEYRRGVLEVDEVLVPSDTTIAPAGNLILWWPRKRDMNHKPHLGNRGIWLLTRGEEAGTWMGRSRGAWFATEYRDTIQWFVDFGITMQVVDPDVAAADLLLRLTIRNLTSNAMEFPGLTVADGIVSADPRLRFRVRAGSLEYPAGSRLVYDESVPPLALDRGQVVRIDLPVGRIWRLAGISSYELRFECDGVPLVAKIGIWGSGVRSLPVGYVER